MLFVYFSQKLCELLVNGVAVGKFDQLCMTSVVKTVNECIHKCNLLNKLHSISCC